MIKMTELPLGLHNIKMILNRKNEPKNIDKNKSNMQKQIEEISKKHLSMYDQVIGTIGVKDQLLNVNSFLKKI